MSKKKSIIYIDGFNLYYGAIKGTKYKWLDLERYFTLLRQDDDIVEIKYFTALIDGSHRQNQEIYLSVLETFPKIQIIPGKFKRKQVKCGVEKCKFKGNKFFDMPEEKRTDVNIAIHMLHDAFYDRCERFVLISGDSDLVPALEMIKKVYTKKELIVYIPARTPVRGAAVELRNLAHRHKILPNELLGRTLLPNPVKDSLGNDIYKPIDW